MAKGMPDGHLLSKAVRTPEAWTSGACFYQTLIMGPMKQQALSIAESKYEPF